MVQQSDKLEADWPFVCEASIAFLHLYFYLYLSLVYWRFYISEHLHMIIFQLAFVAFYKCHMEELKMFNVISLSENRAQKVKGNDQWDEYGMNVKGDEPVSVIKDELKIPKWHNNFFGKSIKVPDKFKENGNTNARGIQKFLLYSISKLLDGSLNFKDNYGKSIYKLIPANSRFRRQLELHDACNRLTFTLREKKFTLHNKWTAIGSGLNIFKVSNSHAFHKYSDLVVKLNKESEKSGFDYKIIRSMADKLTLLVYKGSSAKVVSKVVSDATDKNKYLVEIDSKEDCEILKKIVFSVTTIADAEVVESAGKKNENSFKFGGGVELYSYFGKNGKNVSAVDKHTHLP